MSNESNEHTPESSNTPEKQSPEVRYVPIDYLPEFDARSGDEIDLIELIKKIWDGRWTIIKITSVFIALGLFWALFSPEEFTSEAILMPEVQQQQGGGTSRLLQQFGLGGRIGGAGMEQGVISPLLYPRIANSLSFQRELLNKELHFREYDVTTTWPDFLENHYPQPLTSYAVNYTIGLPFTVLRWVRSIGDSEDELILTDSDVAMDEDQGFITLTRAELEFVKQLNERISVRQDEDTGLITTSVTLQDPRAAAELNRFLVEQLKEYVTDYRIDKARQNLEFAEQQKNEARERFEKAQLELAEFRDQNVSIATARAQTQQERLQSERELTFNVYNSLAQQVEEARLALQEQTPVFTEVQAVNVPSERSAPNRVFLLIGFTFIGGVIGFFWVFGRIVINDLQSNNKINN